MIRAILWNKEFRDLRLELCLKDVAGFYECKCTAETLELVIDILSEEDYNLCLLEAILKEMKGEIICADTNF